MKTVVLTIIFMLIAQTVVLYYYRAKIITAIKIAFDFFDDNDVTKFIKAHHYNLKSSYNLENQLFIFKLKRKENGTRK